jgi:hypothetical protein
LNVRAAREIKDTRVKGEYAETHSERGDGLIAVQAPKMAESKLQQFILT